MVGGWVVELVGGYGGWLGGWVGGWRQETTTYNITSFHMDNEPIEYT